jgi:hypothetical protein
LDQFSELFGYPAVLRRLIRGVFGRPDLSALAWGTAEEAVCGEHVECPPKRVPGDTVLSTQR